MSQYPYPNPSAYAAAAPQPQRTGPIIVGATKTTTTASSTSATRTVAAPAPATTTKSSTTTTKTTSAAAAKTKTAAAAAANNKPSIDLSKVHPEGRYANECIAILGSYALPSEKKGQKRRADCMKTLERLVPPLLLCTNKPAVDDDPGQEEEHGGEENSKKRKPTTESDEKEKSTTGNDQADNKEEGITIISRTEYIQQLQNKLTQYKQQNHFIMERRSNVFKSMVALHELYETGLDGISRMNDLRYVPDNVMPDEVPR